MTEYLYERNLLCELITPGVEITAGYKVELFFSMIEHQP